MVDTCLISSMTISHGAHDLCCALRALESRDCQLRVSLLSFIAFRDPKYQLFYTSLPAIADVTPFHRSVAQLMRPSDLSILEDRMTPPCLDTDRILVFPS